MMQLPAPKEDAIDEAVSHRLIMMQWLTKWYRVVALVMLMPLVAPWWANRAITFQVKLIATAVSFTLFTAAFIPCWRLWKQYMKVIEREEAERPTWDDLRDQIAKRDRMLDRIRTENDRLAASNSQLNALLEQRKAQEITDAQLQADLEQMQRKLHG